MDDCQRKVLTENLVSFCENLDLTEILPFLVSKDILRDYHVEIVQSKASLYNQRSELVKQIKQRGPRAFGFFYQALMHSGQGHLAALLMSHLNLNFCSQISSEERSRSPSPDQIIYPPDKQLLAHPQLSESTPMAIEKNAEFYRELMVVFKTINVMSDLNVEMVDTNSITPNGIDLDQIYPNFSCPKGLALIINNKKFRGGLPDRLGTDVDAVNMTRTLQQLGYQVKLKTNLDASDMLSVMDKFSGKKEHHHCHSAVVVVLTHGENGQLIGSDGRTISVESFVENLYSTQCPALKGKPKLFFLQACRGKNYDSGHFGNFRDGNDDNKLPIVPMQSLIFDANDSNKEEIRRKLPTGSDVLISYSTIPGYVSWRNSLKGTWFIQSLCQMLARHSHRQDILSILTLVNRQVAEAFESSEGSYKQIPEPSFRLLRKFFFFPGLYEKTAKKLKT